MVTLNEVHDYIMKHMFYKERWEAVDDAIREVVKNNAEAILYRELSHHFQPNLPIPLDVIAEQCIYILDQDDSFRRAEMGMSYFFTNGLYLSFDKNDYNRSIARSILHRYPRRRTGRSVIFRTDTFRYYGGTKSGEY